MNDWMERYIHWVRKGVRNLKLELTRVIVSTEFEGREATTD